MPYLQVCLEPSVLPSIVYNCFLSLASSNVSCSCIQQIMNTRYARWLVYFGKTRNLDFPAVSLLLLIYMVLDQQSLFLPVPSSQYLA